MIFANREEQYWATRADWADMEEHIKKAWNDGYAISDMVYGDSRYYVLMEKNTGILSQEYLWKKTFPQTLEQEQDVSDGKCITTVSCDDSSCCIVRSEFENQIDQLWFRSVVFPKQEIEKNWKQGFAITTMSWNNGYWVLVFSKGIDYAQKESWETRIRLKPRKLRRTLDQDMRIVSAACFGDGKWALSYARHPKIYSQKFYIGKEFPEQLINDNWNANHDISKASYGNGLWFFTFINPYEKVVHEQSQIELDRELNAKTHPENKRFKRNYSKFEELYEAGKFEKAHLLFKEHLIHSFDSPHIFILNDLHCLLSLEKYEEGIEVFEHFNGMFDTYHEAMQIGGEIYYQAHRQKEDEKLLRKALKCFSLVSPANSEIEERMDEISDLLSDDMEGEVEWKQKIAQEEQKKRRSDRESKNLKF